jgi:metal-sulfur cluster biosynthetic enzyme
MAKPGPLSRDRVLEALSRIRDPETQAPLTRLGQLDSVEVGENGSVGVTFHPVSPYTPLVLVVKLALDIAGTLRSLEGAKVLRVTIRGHPLSEYLNKSLDRVLESQEAK